MKLRLPVSILAGICAAASALRAQTTFEWIGFGEEDLLITDGRNWNGGQPPNGTGDENLVFGAIGPFSETRIFVPIPAAAFKDITFRDSNRQEYEFNGDGAILSLNGNVTVGPTEGARVFFRGGLTLRLAAGGHTVDIDGSLSSSELMIVNGEVDGLGSLVKTGTGKLSLRGLAKHEGGTIIKQGVIDLKEQGEVAHAGADLVVGETSGDNATLEVPFGGAIAVKNAFVGLGENSTGTITLNEATWTSNTLAVGVAGTGDFTIAGNSIATQSTVIGQTSTGRGTVTLSGGSWANSGSFIVGDAGTGRLVLKDASVLTIGGGNGTLTVGSAGILTIGSGGMGGYLNVASVTGASGSILEFNTDAFDSEPYFFTKNGASEGIAIGGDLQLINRAGYTVLRGTATYTKGTLIQGGTLALGASGALPASGDVQIQEAFGSTVVFNVGDHSQAIGSLTIGGNSGNSGMQVHIGSDGVLTLGGTVTFNGANNPIGASIFGGRLDLGGTRIFDVGNSLNGESPVDLAISSQITGVGSALIKRGSGTLLLDSFVQNDYQGGTIIENGTIVLGTDGVLPIAGAVTINPAAGATAELQLGNTTQTIGALTMGGVSPSSQAIVSMAAEGHLVLGGFLAFDATGNPLGAEINGGVLMLSGSRTFDVHDSTTASSDLSISSLIAGDGFGVLKTGAGTLTLSGGNIYSGPTTINNGRLVISNDNNLGTAPGSPALGHLILNNGSTLQVTSSFALDPNRRIALGIGGGTFDIDASVTLDYGGVIGGTTLTKAGGGTLYLDGANTYSGGTIIAGGTLALGASNSLPTTGAVSLAPSAGTAVLDLNGLSQTIEDLALGGSTTSSKSEVKIGSGGVLTVPGGITFNASVSANPLGATIEGGTLTFASELGISVADSTTAASDLAILSEIIGSGGLVKNGAGVLAFLGTNSYSGGTTIRAGGLALGANNALPGSGNVTIAAVPQGTTYLNLNSFSQSIGSLSFEGGTSLSSAQVIVGSGATLALGGNVSYTANNNPLGASIQGSGTLDLGSSQRTFEIGNSSNAAFDLTVSTPISGDGGGITKAGDGWLYLSAANSYSGPTILDGGTLVIATDSALGVAPVSPTPGHLQFDGGILQASNSFTLNANRGISLAGSGGTLEVSSGMTLNYGGATAGVGALTKAGAGTLTLSGANTHTGGTTITAGSLIVGANNALPTGGNIVLAPPSGAAIFNVNGLSQTINALTFAGGGPSASGQVSIGAGGTLTLNGNLHYETLNNPLGLTIGGGTLNLTGIRNFDIGDSTNVALSEVTISSVIAGAGGFTKTGAGSLTLTGNNTYTGLTTISAGNLSIGNEGLSGSIVGDVLNNGRLIFFRNNNFSYDGDISGTGAVTKSGAGILTLTGSSTYAGQTQILNGTLAIGADNTLPTGGTITMVSGANLSVLNNQTLAALTGPGNVSLASGKTLTLNLSGSNTFSGDLFGAGHFAVNGGGTVILTGVGSFTGSASVTASTLQVGSGGTSGSLAASVVTNGGTVRFNRSDAISYGGAISGSGSFAKTGAGTLTLTGSNTYAGETLITQGKLLLGASGVLPAGGNVVMRGSTLVSEFDLGGNNQTIGSLTLGGPGTVTAARHRVFLSDGTLTLNGDVTFDATNNPALNVIEGPGLLRLNGERTFAIGDSTAGADLTISANVSGATGSLIKTGPGSLVLTENNSYLGATRILGGLLAIATDFNLGDAPGSPTAAHLVLSGGVLNTTASFELDANRGIELGAGGGTFDTTASTTLTYDGVIAGTGGLVKAGAGTLTLTGANSYDGGTTISNGTLVVSNAAALGAGSLMLSGGELVVSPGINLNNAINFGAGGGTIGGNGTFGAPITAGTNITLAPGTSPGTTTFTNTLTWAPGGSYDFEIVSATGGVPGTSHDTIVVAGGGSLNITAASGAKFNLNLLSLSSPTAPGNVSDFNANNAYSWQILSSADPIAGFSADAFNIDTSGFTNPLGIGSFSVAINGTNTALFLNFTPIPEPSTYAMMALGAGALLFTCRRRRRS